MILLEKDINEVKITLNKLKILAVQCCDYETCEFVEKLIYIVERYQDDYDYCELTTHHERQALSFMMRFADRLRDKNITSTCEFSLFENEFLELLDNYIALKHRFNEHLKNGSM